MKSKISTNREQVRSIDDQLAVLRELAKGENLTIAQEYIEKQPAKMPGRPVFNEMLARIEKLENEAPRPYGRGILAPVPRRSIAPEDGEFSEAVTLLRQGFGGFSSPSSRGLIQPS